MRFGLEIVKYFDAFLKTVVVPFGRGAELSYLFSGVIICYNFLNVTTVTIRNIKTKCAVVRFFNRIIAKIASS